MSNLSREIQIILENLKRTPSPYSDPNAVHKCPKCKGTGYIWSVGTNGNEYVIPCECRALMIMQSKLEFADIPPKFRSYTVESFDLSLYQSPKAREMAEMAKTLCANYVRSFREIQTEAKGKGLYLYSQAKGSGKTRMAASIANEIIKKYMISVKFATAIQILDEIKMSWHRTDNDGGEQEFLQEIIRVPVLVIDDVGVERSTAWADEKFYSIINGRMNQNQVTIYTSNRKMEDLTFDDRLISRIIGMALPVPFPEESVRTHLAKTENKDLYQKLLGGG